MKPILGLLMMSVLALASCCTSVRSVKTAPVMSTDDFVFFGTQNAGAGKGFSIAHFNPQTGALTKPEFLQEAAAPAYYVFTRDAKHLYTCNAINTFEGQPTGAISAYALDAVTGKITLINQKPSGGGDPSFISLDKTEHYAFAANYNGGNFCAYAIQPDGSLGERTAFFQHTGKSVNPQRQTHAYAHSIKVDPTNRFVLVADLGLDKLFVYRFNQADGTMTPNDPPFISVKPGSGPRHFTFAPNGKIVYLINEMGSIVIAFNWDSAKGTLREFQTISTLPADFKGTSACAEIMVHPNGKFLYASNRGHDSIALFSIDQKTGMLKLLETTPTMGKTPRNFEMDPSQRWIIVTNHGSDNAVIFSVDPRTGHLQQTGDPVSVPYPFCPRFLPVAKADKS